jgi:hypothetical protein
MNNDQTITQPTIFITFLLVALIFALPRRHVLVPYILASCFIPAHEHAMVLGLHFYVIRILVLAGIMRIWLRGEVRQIRWNRFDKLLLGWTLCGTAIYVIQQGDFQAVIYRSGQMVEILGMYWIGRQSIRSWDDMKRMIRVFAISGIILVPFFALEWATAQNPFSVLGRVDTGLREGELRCRGPFSHYIVAGSFWACLFPLFVALAKTERRKPFYWAAAGSAVFIIMACHSSTPLGGLAAVIIFLAAYQYRALGRSMAIGFFACMIALHLVMKAPVWFLLGRIHVVAGSTGFHRALLIDRAVRYFGEWALFGTTDTSHWGTGLWDVTNQYILEGVRGGLLTMVLFVALLAVAIRTAGHYSTRKLPRERQWLSWAFCVSIIAHCVMFISLAYFGQILMLLYLTFACIGMIYGCNTLPQPAAASRRVPARARSLDEMRAGVLH